MKDNSRSKRHVPRWLRVILELDGEISRRLCSAAGTVLPLRKWKPTFKLLEFSCHGVPTILFTLAGIYLFKSSRIDHFLVNVLVALLVDLIAVAVLKCTVRRRRPAPNTEDRLTVRAIDQYSFPSGHASRALLLARLLLDAAPTGSVWQLPLVAWASCVCASRLLLRRHYLLDVAAGALLGGCEAALATSWLWLSPASCNCLLNWLGDSTGDDAGAVELDL